MKSSALQYFVAVAWILCLSAIRGQHTSSINSSESRRDSVTANAQWYVETDPSAWLFKGLSLQVRRSCFFNNRMIVSLGYYKVSMPEFWINSIPSNINKGWSARVKHGIDVYVDYHVFKANKSLFAGVGLSLYNFQIRRNDSRSQFNSLLLMVRAGYLWRPFKKNFYVLPVAGISYNKVVGGNNTIDGESLLIKKLSFVPTINLGVSF